MCETDEKNQKNGCCRQIWAKKDLALEERGPKYDLEKFFQNLICHVLQRHDA